MGKERIIVRMNLLVANSIKFEEGRLINETSLLSFVKLQKLHCKLIQYLITRVSQICCI